MKVESMRFASSSRCGEKRTGVLRGISGVGELDFPPEKFLKRHSNDFNYFLIYVDAITGHMEPLFLHELHNLFQAFIEHLFCPKMQR